MQKSKAERERLLINAKAQQVLSRQFITEAPKTGTVTLATKAQRGTTPKVLRVDKPILINDVYQPTGEIDYSRFNKAKS